MQLLATKTGAEEYEIILTVIQCNLGHNSLSKCSLECYKKLKFAKWRPQQAERNVVSGDCSKWTECVTALAARGNSSL